MSDNDTKNSVENWWDEGNVDERPSDVLPGLIDPGNPFNIDIELSPKNRNNRNKRRTAVIRTSDRLLFKRCRRRWGWQSHLKQNLGSRTAASPLWLGSGFHYALEDFHGDKIYGHPAAAIEAYCVATIKQGGQAALPPSWQDDLKLGKGMLRYYADDWLRTRYNMPTFVYPDQHGIPTLQNEVNFRISIPFDQDLLNSWGYDDCVYSGTLDRVAIDEQGLLWIFEYKTAKLMVTHHFATDPQVTAYCVPLDSEVMTRKGWRKHSDLTIGEEVLGYNQYKDCLEWTPLEAVRTFNNQKVNKISNKSFEFRATPNHRWVRGVKAKGMSYKGKNLPPRIIVDTLDKYKDNSFLIMASELDASTLKLTEDEGRVLGWLLTDGTFGTYDRGDRASIGQKKYFDVVQNLLDRIPNSYTRTTLNGDTTIWHLQMDFFHDLFDRAGLNMELDGWEQFCLGMSPRVRQAFCEAASLGDGSINGQFYQNLGRKQDLFRLAFFLTGVFPSKGFTGGKGNQWSECPDNTFCLTTDKKWMKCVDIKEDGISNVWCPQTKLGTWVMRQGRQITITGNCWAAELLYPGYSIGGVIYQQHRKTIPDAPRMLASGKLSDTQRQTTDYWAYRRAIEAIYGSTKQAPSKYIDTLNHFSGLEQLESNAYIRRDRLYRNEHQTQAEGTKILLEAAEMLNPELALYPNPTRDCNFCGFQGPCVGMDSGEDWEQEMEIYNKPRETFYDSWRKKLPNPETFKETIDG